MARGAGIRFAASFFVLALSARAVGAERAIPPSPPPSERASTLVIGRVSDDPSRDVATLLPMVRWVASKMADVGIQRGEVRLARDNEEMAQLLANGEIDWISETPFSAVQIAARSGSELALRRHKGGEAEYRALFLVPKESPIESLRDLVGKRVAFEDIGSSSGYFVPKLLLEREGLSLVRLESPREPVPAGKVGYVFAGSELNVAAWVHRGLVDAGATDDLTWNDPKRIPASIRQGARQLLQSDAFPRSVELFSPKLGSEHRERLRAVLLGAAADPTGGPALRAFGSTTRFDELTGEAAIGMEAVRRLLGSVPTKGRK